MEMEKADSRTRKRHGRGTRDASRLEEDGEEAYTSRWHVCDESRSFFLMPFMINSVLQLSHKSSGKQRGKGREKEGQAGVREDETHLIRVTW